MRTRIGIIVAALVLLGAGAYLATRNAEPVDAAATQALESPGTEASDKAQAPGASKVVAQPVDSDLPTLEAPVRGVRLSSAERRPDEKQDAYDMRMAFLDKFEKLERQAGLTSEQRQAVLSIMADMQQQSQLAWKEMDAATASEDSPSMSVVDKTLSAELLARLREVLPHEQMIAFRRIAIIGKPLMFENYRPIDIDE